MTNWKPIETAPEDRRILIKNSNGVVYAADPATSMEGEKGFVIIRLPESGEPAYAVVNDPVEWAEIPE